MAYLLFLLPVLACPLMMGVMMWLMMRGNKGRPADQAHQTHNTPVTQPTKGIRNSPLGGFHLCLNWKVVAGLAAVGVGIWVVAPGSLWAAAPVLLVLACPLSMLFMMRGMGSGQRAAHPVRERRAARADVHDQRLVDLRAQPAAIVGEFVELESVGKAIAADPHTNGAPVHERS